MANKSTFQFNDFLINKSTFELTEKVNDSELSVGFNPSGKLDMNNHTFHLNLGIKIANKSKSVNIEIESTGFFEFENFELESLKPFLFQNAPAILFPYIRAYISTLTTQSGIQPIVLPTFNLSDLKEELEQNIEEASLE